LTNFDSSENLEFEIITYPHQKKYNTDEKMDGRVIVSHELRYELVHPHC
jgi:hypothetical protein